MSWNVRSRPRAARATAVCVRAVTTEKRGRKVCTEGVLSELDRAHVMGMSQATKLGWMRARLAVRQNRAALVFVVVWVALAFGVLVEIVGLRPGRALAVATCLVKGDGGLVGTYQTFTQLVVFGLVVSTVVTNVTRRYRPEETSRALAGEARDHVVVVGLSNLGRRAVDRMVANGASVVVVDPDAERCSALVREGHAVVRGEGRTRSALEAASVAHAKVVLLTADDLEDVAVAARHVRALSPTCELVVRCSDDDVASVLSKAYRARVVSTSKVAAEVVLGHAKACRAKKVVVLGATSVGVKVAAALAHARIPCTLADPTESHEELSALGVPSADLVLVADDDLGKNLVLLDRIRDVAPRVKIVCRVFHDEAAELLERAPFSCVVVSSSRTALESLVRAGVFREVGVVDAPEPASGRPVFAVSA